MKKKNIYIGCSSYNTADWKGVFYPENLPKTKWFEYYCEHFSTYELNSTFYRFPTLKSLQSWHDKTPENFLFSIKAPKQITHIHRFKECRQLIEDFYMVSSEGLAGKLGCVLFQLPPGFDYSASGLELIVNSLNPEFKNVVEFRNQSWWIPEVFDALKQRNITFCSVNYPKLPSDIMVTSDIGYVRFHGNPKLFYSAYDREILEKAQSEILGTNEFKEVFVYFNNTASTAGILNALEMKELLKSNRV